MATKISKKTEKKLHVEAVKQMVTLSTSGFGLVAALAWNSVIQEFVNSYIKKWLPEGSGLISLLIYAVIITILAVTVTLQLSRFSEKLQGN
jgi:Zn-dependent protease with chaperone function